MSASAFSAPALADFYWQGPSLDEAGLLVGFEITGGAGLLFSDLIVGTLSFSVARTVIEGGYHQARAALAHLHRSDLKIIMGWHVGPCLHLHNPTDLPVAVTIAPRVIQIITQLASPYVTPPESPRDRMARVRTFLERASMAIVYDEMLLFPTALVRAQSSLDFDIVVLTGGVREILTPKLVLTGIERISEVDLEVRTADGTSCSTVYPTHIRGVEGDAHRVVYTLANTSDADVLVSPVGFVRAVTAASDTKS